MMISLIAAASENNVIGQGAELPWHLPDDLKHFKRLTVDHSVIMGRRTFDTLGRPLPRRSIVVISRSPQADREGVLWAENLDEALKRAAASSPTLDDAAEPEVFVAGGGEIYRLALECADRIYLTRIHARVDGDVFFPELDPSQWLVVDEQHHPADERHAHPFTFKILEPVTTRKP
jgi:dihydrofolate reductase